MSTEQTFSALLEVEEYASDILTDETIEKMSRYAHHKSSNIFDHSLYVAVKSINFANLLSRLGINIDKQSLVRGALLHDYFLYDWHKNHKLHGFTHPKVAYVNASRDFEVNDIEKNIIQRHMFPLTLIPPTKKESIIVCLMDKVCATKEIFRNSKG